jgi:hypothetical protein
MSLAKSYFEKNKGKKWHEWLDFDCTFEKPGKQGLVGLLKLKEDANVKYIFKISQTINYLVNHESLVMEGLSEISKWLPHFPLFIGKIKAYVNPKNRKSGNPFDVREDRCKIITDVLLCEYIENSCKFYNYIKATEKISNEVLINCIKQVLLAISIAQDKKQFAHYDLHSNNIMMRQCDKNLVLCYVIDDSNQIAIPTFGHIPTIIDFGFSYINNMENSPCWPSMGHTEAGYFSDHFDHIMDPKLFLVSVTKEIKMKRNKSTKFRELRKIVKNVFGPLDISWSCGWNKDEKISASDYVSDMLEPYGKKSKVFTEYLHYSLDIIQSLIILPFEEKVYKNKISEVYKIFINQWIKIEEQIKTPYFNMYILKEMIDIARELQIPYKDKTKQISCENEFRTKLLKIIDNQAKWFRSDKIDFRILLCSIYMLANCIEGVFYDVMLCLKKKNKDKYDKMCVNSILQIFAAIDINCPSVYKYTKDTKVVMVCENQKIVELDNNSIDLLNNSHPLTHGTILYNLSQN